MTKEKKYMIIGIFILMITLVGGVGTYAWFTWKSTSNTSLTMTIGKMADVTFSSGNDISTNKLAPVYNYTDGEKTTFIINNRDTTNTFLKYKILLDITSIADELKSTNLKYKLLSNNTILAEGSFSTFANGSTNTLYEDTLNTGVTDFVFYLYIDGNEENNLNMMNKQLNGTLKVTTESSPVNFASYVDTKYSTSTKTVVTNNNISYNYVPSLSLINDKQGGTALDEDGNIRYYGASPNNYVYFNCSTYPTTNCELWRIIGTFGDKIKIVRNESIGKYSWDNKDKTTGAETNYGKNDWTDARLMKLLNPGYDNESVGGSLYYNAKSGTCYVNQNNATTACNFTSTGIKNDTTKNIIAEVTYNTAGYNDATLYPNEIYTYERGSTVYSGRQTTWTGKIGLMYPSDYGYASDLTKCREKINNYNASTCSQNNWIYNMGSLWLLTHDSARSDRNWSINSSGNASVNGNGNGGTSNGLLVFPSLFLSSGVKIISGNGSINNPYQLGV
ncbi:MAG TPA: hypothetical protein DHV54_03525 [Firmicutes bacterium]|nr:hypothetical protein [Bacillota bacterium]